MKATLKVLACMLLTLCCASSATAATSVSGLIVNQTWTKANSPYLVIGNILVSRLTIQPGVHVQFQSNYVFEVAGRLTAVGLPNDMVIFSRGTNSTTAWPGIYFNESLPGSELTFCAIGGANASGVRSLNTAPVLRDCVISNNIGGGISLSAGINMVVLSRCLFRNNTNGGSGGGGGVYVSAPVAFFDSCIFMGNRSGNSGGGILSVGAATVFTNCTFLGNSAGGNGGGLYMLGRFEMHACRIEQNSAGSPGQGIFADKTSALINCIVVNHTSGSYAIRTQADMGLTNCTVAFNAGPALYSTVSGTWVVNSIFWGNGNPQIQANPGFISVAYSDVQGGWFGQGNFSFNPIFYSPSNFALVDGSPCIDAGSPDPSFNDLCFPPSAGTNRNDMGAYGGPGACAWPIAPRITTQPRSQVNCVGRSVTFSASAIGEPPLTYQWQFNGGDLAGATNASYTISNLQSNHAGLYSVRVSNMFGIATSEPASLTVNPVCVAIDLYAGLTIGGLVGQTYRVEYVTQLAATNQWAFLTNVFQGMPEVLWVDPQPATLERRIYRVLPPP